MNEFQKRAIRAYAAGDHAHIAGLRNSRQAVTAIAQCGDTLLRFIFAELADEPGEPMTPTMAHHRMQNALRDVTVIANLFGEP